MVVYPLIRAEHPLTVQPGIHHNEVPRFSVLHLDLAIGEKNIFRHEDCTVLSPLNLIGSWREESRAPTENQGT